MANPIEKLESAPKKKRLSWQLGCVTVFGVFLIILVILNSIQVIKYETYSSPEYGFEIKYPAVWTKQEKPDGGAVVAFLCPPENSMDTITENINVVYQDLSKSPVNLRQFSQMAIRQLTMTFGEAIQVLDDRGVSVAGLPGHRFMYAGTDKTGALQILHLWVVDGTRAFIITYTAPKDSFLKYLGYANTIANSFKLTGK